MFGQELNVTNFGSGTLGCRARMSALRVGVYDETKRWPKLGSFRLYGPAACKGSLDAEPVAHHQTLEPFIKLTGGLKS